MRQCSLFAGHAPRTVVGARMTFAAKHYTTRDCVSLHDCDTFDDILLNPEKYTPAGSERPIDPLNILSRMSTSTQVQGVVIHGPATPLSTTSVYMNIADDQCHPTVSDPWGSPVETGRGWLAYIQMYPAGSMLQLHETGVMPRLILLKHACIDQVRVMMSIIMTTQETDYKTEKAHNIACDVVGAEVPYRAWHPLIAVRHHIPASQDSIRSLYNLHKQCTMHEPRMGYTRMCPNAERETSSEGFHGGLEVCPLSGVHEVVGQLFGIKSLVARVTKEALTQATMYDNVPVVVSQRLRGAIGLLHGAENDARGSQKRATHSMDVARSVVRALDLSTVCALWASTATRMALPRHMNSPTGAPLVLALCVRLATGEDLCVANNPHFAKLIPPKTTACHAAILRLDRLFRMQFPPLNNTIECAIDLLWTVSVLQPPSYETQAERTVFHDRLWQHIAELVLRGRGLVEALFGPEHESRGWADSVDNGHSDPLGLDMLCTRSEAASAALRMMVMIERFCRDGEWPSKGALSALSTVDVEMGDRDGRLASELCGSVLRPLCPFVHTHRPNPTRRVAENLLFGDMAPFTPPPWESCAVLHQQSHMCESATRMLLYGGCESQSVELQALLVSPNQYSPCARDDCNNAVLPLATAPFSSHGRCCATCGRFFCEKCFVSFTCLLAPDSMPMYDCTCCRLAKQSVCSSLLTSVQETENATSSGVQ